MQITKSRIKEIIREELSRVNESDDPHFGAFDYDIDLYGLHDMVEEHGGIVGKFWRGNDIIIEFDDGTEYNATGGDVDTDYTPGRERGSYRKKYYQENKKK